MKTDHQRRRRRSKGGADFELMVVVLALLGGVAGFFYGLDFGWHYGVFVGLAGGVLGAVVGLLGTLLAMFLLVLVLSPLDTLAERFARWWRPYPPVCENGTCIGRDAYRRCEIPEEAVNRVRGLCRSGYRCKCGNVYATGYDYGMQRRFLRVLADGKLRPYLRFRIFGRWRADDGRGIIEITPDYVEPPPREIPGWTIPLLSTAICAGIAWCVVYLPRGRKPHPIDPWFVLGVAALGLVMGCVVWWRGPPKQP
jgi:hypothetical protein